MIHGKTTQLNFLLCLLSLCEKEQCETIFTECCKAFLPLEVFPPQQDIHLPICSEANKPRHVNP